MIIIKEQNITKVSEFDTWKLTYYYSNGKIKEEYFDSEKSARYWKSMDLADDFSNEINHIDGPTKVRGTNFKSGESQEWWEE